MLDFAILGVGVLGPGLANWADGQALLREPAHWQRQATAVPPPARLPANERRRAGIAIKASIEVADQAAASADLDPAALATVFSSSTGDPANCHLLCEALAGTERLASPTRFTNSVHNAPAGYWHIATQSPRASTSLAAYDASFGAGLLEAAVQCLSVRAPVLLVACDVPYPEPLHRLRPLPDVFALAVVLAPRPAAAHGRRTSLGLAPEQAPTRCDDARLEALRHAIPAARALPLLQVLAGEAAARLVLEGPPGLALELAVSAR
jgi:hypothetical protein